MGRDCFHLLCVWLADGACLVWVTVPGVLSTRSVELFHQEGEDKSLATVCQWQGAVRWCPKPDINGAGSDFLELEPACLSHWLLHQETFQDCGQASPVTENKLTRKWFANCCHKWPLSKHWADKRLIYVKHLTSLFSLFVLHLFEVLQCLFVCLNINWWKTSPFSSVIMLFMIKDVKQEG